MRCLRRSFVLTAVALILVLQVTGTARAEDIADYTSFPPFLPRVVSPNILFILDYSASMVRPAYGTCSSDWQDCRYKFFNHLDDYSSSIKYEGYFDNDGYKYSCSAGYSGSAMCEKDSAGEFDGNWLNWLAMTQFDILKKTMVGGDVTSPPETGNPTKLQSLLTNDLPTDTTFREFYKVVSESECTANAPDALCDTATPQKLPYKWIDTPATADFLWGKTSYVDDTPMNRALPFRFNYFGSDYTRINLSENGYIQFTNADESINGDWSNDDIPSATSPNNLVAVMWDDLVLSSSADSYVAMFTVGSSPNRITVITWEQVFPWSNTTTGGVSFQVLLFEGSNQILFQYKDVDGDLGTYTPFAPDLPNNTDKGESATIGLENSDGTLGKKYSAFGSTLLENNLALHMTYGYKVFTVLPGSSKIPGTNSNFSETLFFPQGTTSEYRRVYIDIKNDNTCPSGYYLNKTNGNCYDHHVTDGFLQELRDGELAGLLGFRLGIMQLNEEDGGKVVKHFNQKDANGWSSLMAATRGQRPTAEAPLAEALHMAQGYFRQDTAYNLGISTSSSSWTNNGTSAACNFTGNNYDPYCFQSYESKVSCVKSFALLVSSGNYSHDFENNIYDTTILATDKVPLASAMRLTLGEVDANARKSRNYGGLLDNVAYQMRAPDTSPPDLRSDIEGNQVAYLFAVNSFGAGSGDGAEILKRAAIYGGFKDENGNGAYDSEDTNGNCLLDSGEDVNGNGVLDAEDDCTDPSTYFQADNTGGLRAKIVAAVTEILKNSASGTSVSVLSTSAGGEGALYQAYFYPAKIENQKEDRKWPGYLRAFFLDRFQNLRDDNSSSSGSGTPDARLVLDEDRVAQMHLNTATNEVNVDLIYDSDGVLPTSPTVDETVLMDAVPSVWEAGQKLALRDKNDRKIYLWLDLDHDGVVDDGDFNNLSGEAMEFSPSAAATLQPYLRTAETTGTDSLGNPITLTTADEEAENVINFIRGYHVQGYNQTYRSRCISITGASQETGCPGSTQRVWPLGDIVYSTPTLVAAPGEKYDLIYSDASYRAFTQEYKNRRQRVFVGANDGQLHAFNAGVYHSGDDTSTSSQTETGWFTANPASGNGWGSVELGDELRSFVPYDILPHLAWLACNGTDSDPSVCGDSEYTHVYYADHRPKVTDVQIFNYTDPGGDAAKDFSGIAGQPGSDVHTRGWGTIMIVPLRFGGGAIDVDLNGDGDKLDAGEQSFRSAYYAFDITDPEQKPKLLWRFTHNDLGFSTSYPGIVRVESGSTTKWFMVVGSGPTNTTSLRDYGTNNTATNGKVFIVDLETGLLATTSPIDTGVGNAIMGDPTVVDVDTDFTADVIYIGSAVSTTGGQVFRINTKGDTDPNNWSESTLIVSVGPVLVGPSASKDIKGNLWVFFGTGRLRGSTDITNSEQQRFYGIKDRCWSDVLTTACSDPMVGDGRTSAADYAYSETELLDTSNVRITSDTGGATQVSDSTFGSPACGGSADCDYKTLLLNARAKKGWYFNLNDPADPQPSERVLSRSSVLGGLVLFTSYQPSQDICSVLGSSRLYALYYETGTAYNKSVVGTYTDSGTEYISDSVSLGQGMPTSVGVAIGETVSGFVQKSTGEIVRIEAEPGLGVRSGPASWREKVGAGGSVEIETIYKHIVK